MNSPGIVGAGYVAALLTGDAAMAACYTQVFDASELREAIDTQLMILGRRVASESGRTTTELGDALIGAAVMLDRLDLSL